MIPSYFNIEFSQKSLVVHSLLISILVINKSYHSHKLKFNKNRNNNFQGAEKFKSYNYIFSLPVAQKVGR